MRTKKVIKSKKYLQDNAVWEFGTTFVINALVWNKIRDLRSVFANRSTKHTNA